MPEASSASESNPTRAPLPALTPEFIAKHYPDQLRVVHVDLLHRHGERTPVAHRIPEISPRHWNFCAAGNRLHQDFLRAVDHSTGSAAATPDGGADRGGQWQNFIFKKDARSGSSGAVFGVTSAEAQHASDASQPTDATCGFGQLTDTGRHSMAALGAHMRALYVDALRFLPDTLQTSSTLYLRTTSYTRTFESLQHTLGGLYPDLPSASPLLRVHVRPSDRDNLFPDFSCKGMVRQFIKLNAQNLERRGDDYQRLYQDMLAVPSLRAFFGTEFKPGKARVAISVMDVVAPMRAHGVALPDGVSDDLIARVTRMAAVEYLQSAWQSPALARMQIGRLVHELAGNVVDAVQADRAVAAASQARLSIYSGHDTTLAPLLAVFGHDAAQPVPDAPADLAWPAFAASMRIELLKDTASPHPTVQPAWEQDAAHPSADPLSVPFDKRIRPTNVPQSLYQWSSGRGRLGPTGAVNPRATRDYYVRVWYNDRTLRLPTCRDPGAHHSQLGPSVCTLDGFFKQIARFAATEKETRGECLAV
ncbi:hypothetical protein LPJ70_003298 [Coemansia sp. RSA 2708]|nr:hypothetical protein LPJ70_003298 [Coemansia sp. RSA 2708]KAJ2314545.1 hypothetical protein IWW54_000854 [Coemansia sp. RSA 2705]KAJ2738601.1 hypothetical protein H4R23_001035 [Coemansia sp. Cherry 401B]